MPPRIWRWSVLLQGIYSWPSVVMRSWTRLSKLLLLAEVSFLLQLIFFSVLHKICCFAVKGYFRADIVLMAFLCLSLQVWFHTSTSHWLERRASRKLYKMHWCSLLSLYRKRQSALREQLLLCFPICLVMFDKRSLT